MLVTTVIYLCLLLGSLEMGFGFVLTPFATMTAQSRSTRRGEALLFVAQSRHADDAEENATPLVLSVSDMKRFKACQTRQKTMPILILDSMVPKQELSFESSDPSLVKLIQYCLENDSDAAMVGINPSTGSPLSRGVTISVDARQVRLRPSRQSVVLSVTAERRIEVQSQPWLDKSGSFYLSEVDVIDDMTEPPLSPEHERMAQRLYESLPTAMEEWSEFVLQSGATDQQGLKDRLESLGPMPSDMTDRAFWVAAAINPLPALGVCIEIRPAMLCCTNDYERMVLACQAVRSSIDHVSGKRRLF
ncbi:hypothetical protein ACA910_011058 [Epithemia clementina (nom. ined.)]